MVVNYRQQSLIRPLPQKSKCLTEEEESGVGANHAKDQKAEAEGMAHGRNSQNFRNSCQQLEQKLPKLLKILSSTGLSDKTKPAPPPHQVGLGWHGSTAVRLWHALILSQLLNTGAYSPPT
jgi:hypothetical protein